MRMYAFEVLLDYKDCVRGVLREVNIAMEDEAKRRLVLSKSCLVSLYSFMSRS